MGNSLLRRFLWIAGLVALAGIALALYADRPSARLEPGLWDAIREIGGALVAGAVVAALVLWFEERREDQRVNREVERETRQHRRDEERSDESMRNAWRRELDIQLVRLIHSELASARTQRLNGLHEAALMSEGRAQTPELLEHFRRSSDRTISDLVVRQIIAILNLIPQSPTRASLQGAVMRWNTNDYEMGGMQIMTRIQFNRLQNIEDKHWMEITGRLADYLLQQQQAASTEQPDHREEDFESEDSD